MILNKFITWEWFFRLFVGSIFFVTLYMIGCSDTHFASLKTVSCEDFLGSFGDLPGGADCHPTRLGGQGGFDNPNDPQGFSNLDNPRNKNKRGKDGKDPLDDTLLSDPDRNFLEFEYSVPLGEIDIIFVVDNSSSMNAEHQNIANQFYDFLSDIRFLKYRIAIITTDISSSPANLVKNAPYQDGKFISIGGRPYLSNSKIGALPDKKQVDKFIEALVRPETLACDINNRQVDSVDEEYYFTHGIDKVSHGGDIKCPSHDERGIFALNRALENTGQRSFFRSGVHLMAVIISDEDERSSYSFIQDRKDAGEDVYKFEARDYPEFLVENLSNIFPLKGLSVHSIIIPPGDTECLRTQQRRANEGPGSGSGFFGYEYERLALAKDRELLKFGNLVKGQVISICERNYGSQLSRVGFLAGEIKATLPCSEPERITAFIDGNRTPIYYDIQGRTLLLKPGQVQLSSELILNVICEE